MSSMLSPAQWILFLALYRASYETANVGQETQPAESAPTQADGSLGMLTPSEQEWAKKAARRYAQAQELKWRRWREAMFEAR